MVGGSNDCACDAVPLAYRVVYIAIQIQTLEKWYSAECVLFEAKQQLNQL